MGFPITRLFGAIVVAQIGTWAGLGYFIYSQQQTQLRILALEGELLAHRNQRSLEHPTSRVGAGAGPESDPPVGDSISGPGLGGAAKPSCEWGFHSFWATPTISRDLCFLLVVLVVLLVIGTFLRWRLGTGEVEVVSPRVRSPKEIAHRQLAELRLRHHGFGQ